MGLVLISGCEMRETKKEYIARVGNSYVSIEEIQSMAGDTLSPEQLREYVVQWMDQEMLYQEARRLGVENSKEVRRKLDDVRKQLVVQEFLTKEIYGDSVELTDDSIRAYFEAHPEDFLLQEDMVKVNYAAFARRERANAFRARLIGGASWEAAVEAAYNDTATDEPFVAQAYLQYYTQRSLYPRELWRVATNLSAGEVSFPVRTQSGFFVIQTLAILKQGKRPELDMVRNEIFQRLTMEHRRQRYAELLARVRSQSDVEMKLP